MSIEELEQALKEQEALVSELKGKIQDARKEALVRLADERQNLKFMIHSAIGDRRNTIKKLKVSRQAGSSTELLKMGMAGVVIISDKDKLDRSNMYSIDNLFKVLQESRHILAGRLLAESDCFHTIVLDVIVGRRILNGLPNIVDKLDELASNFNIGTRGVFNSKIQLVILTN